MMQQKRWDSSKPPVGHRFSLFTVLGLGDRRTAKGQCYWVVQCVCGTTKEVKATRIVTGETKSCGCRDGRVAQRASVTKYSDPLQKCWNDVLRRYKDKAAKRGRVFELSAQEFFSLIKSPCRYCGRIGADGKSWPTWNAKAILKLECNGVDRLNSDIGYVAGNCVPCCHTCNVMKLRMSEQEFIAHARLILSNLKGLQSCQHSEI